MTVPWRSPLDLATGSAESLKPERRPFRISGKVWLLVAAGVIAFVIFSMVGAASPDSMSTTSDSTAPTQADAQLLQESPVESPLEGSRYENGGRAVGVPVEARIADTSSLAGERDGSYRAYALPLARISGLPSSAAPGTRLNLWALWEPPVTKEPSAQLLIRDIVLERIVPAVTPDGPETAILLVPRNRISDLIYADRFSQISAALIR
jgi:hypothetical protein